MQGATPEVLECLARGEAETAPLSKAEHALLRFVELVTMHAYRTTDADVETLRAVGWTDENDTLKLSADVRSTARRTTSAWSTALRNDSRTIPTFPLR